MLQITDTQSNILGGDGELKSVLSIFEPNQFTQNHYTIQRNALASHKKTTLIRNNNVLNQLCGNYKISNVFSVLCLINHAVCVCEVQ